MILRKIDCTSNDWIEYRVPFLSERAFVDFAMASVPDVIRDSLHSGSAKRAFFVRKNPGLRLRIHWTKLSSNDPVQLALQALMKNKPDSIGPSVYLKPYQEIELFGGQQGCDLAEQFFTDDSLFLLTYARAQIRGEQTLPPLALSRYIIRTLFGAVATDSWELWSMWINLAQLRTTTGAANLTAMIEDYTLPTEAGLTEAFENSEQIAKRLASLNDTGLLDAPARAIIPIWAAFHLNRMGFDATTQAGLALTEAHKICPHKMPSSQPHYCNVAFERVALGPDNIFSLPYLDKAYTELLRQSSANLLAELERRVPGAEIGTRRALLAVKRALYNNRRPRDNELTEASAILPTGIRNQLSREIQRIDRTPQMLASAIQDAQQGLLTCVLSDAEMKVLNTTHSRITSKLPLLQNKDQTSWNKRDRQLFRTALKLLWRHSGRTTPFAHFAATRIFDPKHPMVESGFLHVPEKDAISSSSPFAHDYYKIRPAKALPKGFYDATAIASTIFSELDAPCHSPSQQFLVFVLAAMGFSEGGLLTEIATKAEAIIEGSGLPADRETFFHYLAVALSIDPIYVTKRWIDSSISRQLCKDETASIPVPESTIEAIPRRVSIRLQPLSNTAILRFLGSDRMSLLARYLPTDQVETLKFRKEAATWFMRWPETLDVTGHSIHPLDHHKSLTLRPLQRELDGYYLQKDDSGYFELRDANGLEVSPSHFGVSRQNTLSISAQFALLAGSRRPSWGEWFIEQVNAAIITRISGTTEILQLPQINIGAALTIFPKSHFLPASSPIMVDLAAGNMVVVAKTFADAEISLGPVLATPIGAIEPQAIDLRIPAGVQTLARLGKVNGVVFEAMPLGFDGRVAPEYYLELASK